MTETISRNDELFQERIDELLLIEERAERRAEDLLKNHALCQAQTQVFTKEVVQKIAALDGALVKISEACLRFGEYVHACERYRDRTTQLFLGVLVLSLLILTGTLAWSYFINEQLAGAKEELASLQVELRGTPVVKTSEGKDYIRVKPNSAVTFGRGKKKLAGTYAEIEYARK